MNTRELIERLQELDPDGTMPVAVDDGLGTFWRVEEETVRLGYLVKRPRMGDDENVEVDSDTPHAFRAVVL